MRVPVRPRWIVFSALVVLVAVACAVLGFWQLGRFEERRASNAVLESRLGREPVSLDEMRSALQPVEGIEPDPSDYEFTPLTARGVLVDEGRVVVRSQVVNGQAGVHAVLPLALEDGSAVLVNVGWFPLGVDPGPATVLFPPSGRIELTGLLRADQQRPAFGRRETEGPLETVARIDVGRIQEQVGLPLLPFWIQLVGPDDPERLPIPVTLPAVDDGPHLSYAVQWFSFGSIALVGYVALMRRELGLGRRRSVKAG
jgi:surfeit locus 1 family protein